MMTTNAKWLLAFLLFSSACSRADPQSVEPGPKRTGTSKHALIYEESSVESKAILAYVNASSTSAQRLQDDALLRKDGAAAIVARRDGLDGSVGTADDQRFTTIEQLRALPSFYDSYLPRLYHAAARAGKLQRDVSVVFSPQPLPESNTKQIADLIDRAQTSLDVAMFSHTENVTGEALKRAAHRGVKVRYLLDGVRQAVEDNRKVDFFASLEQAGIDIRYVEPGIHHKFIVADGPRDSLEAAKAARIALGSANLSYTASAESDENTLFFVNERKVTLKLQREFNLLWKHSVDYVSEGAEPRPPELSTAIIHDSNIPTDADADVYFTSSNFQSAGDKLVLQGRYAVANEIVRAISSTRYSIVVTSSFLRSRPIAEALIAKKAQSPSVNIRVLINQGDFVSQAEHQRQVAEQATCIGRAGTDAQKLELCSDASLSYGYVAETKGIEVRYKLYAYDLERPGPLMHQKYIVIDNETLLTGSYNLSYSSEHKTFENVVMLKGTRHRSLIRQYVNRFYDLWHLGAEENQFDATMQAIQGNDVPLVFGEDTHLKPMTLTRSQINAIRSAIWTGCGLGNPPVRYGQRDFRGEPITCKRRAI